MSPCAPFISALARKKFIDPNAVTDTQLSRCLNTLDLTALGKASFKLKCLKPHICISLLFQVSDQLLAWEFTSLLAKLLGMSLVLPLPFPSSLPPSRHFLPVPSLLLSFPKINRIFFVFVFILRYLLRGIRCSSAKGGLSLCLQLRHGW